MLRHHSLNLLLGSLVLAVVALAALSAPFVTPYAPDQVLAGGRLAAPGPAHWFGTDALGRDMFSRVLAGSAIALGAVLAGALVSIALGLVPGLWAGYLGGGFDRIASRLMEAAQAFPGLLLALLIVARLGPSLANAVLALGIIGAPGFYRLSRSLALSARGLSYVEAARAVGAGDARIVVHHLLPNLAPSLVVLAAMRSGQLLLALGGLSFLGLGAQPPAPEWGALLAAGRNYLETAPWLAVYPGLWLTTTVVGLNLLGDGLRDRLDARGPST